MNRVDEAPVSGKGVAVVGWWWGGKVLICAEIDMEHVGRKESVGDQTTQFDTDSLSPLFSCE